MATKKWYAIIDDRQAGPFSAAEFKKLAAEKTIAPTSKVRKEGMQHFVAASRIKGLFPPQSAADTVSPDQAISEPQLASAFVRDCLSAPFESEPDDRHYTQIPLAAEIVKLANAKDPRALELVERLRREMPDWAFSYSWLYTLHFDAGNTSAARAALADGLKHARKTVYLLFEMGELEFRMGDLLDAVRWWSHSIVVQMRTGKHTDHDAFLYLAHLADLLALCDSCNRLLQQSDSIRSGQLRLDPQTVRRLQDTVRPLSRNDQDDICEVIRRLSDPSRHDLPPADAGTVDQQQQIQTVNTEVAEEPSNDAAVMSFLRSLEDDERTAEPRKARTGSVATQIGDAATRVADESEYFEVARPTGDGVCSDDQCPCDDTPIPRGTGYLYINENILSFRGDCPTWDAFVEKGAQFKGMFFGSGTVTPVLMCEAGARRRRLDLAVAANDARHWWSTGLVPYRATPFTVEDHASSNNVVRLKSTSAGASTETTHVGSSNRQRVWGDLAGFAGGAARDIQKLRSTNASTRIVEYGRFAGDQAANTGDARPVTADLATFSIERVQFVPSPGFQSGFDFIRVPKCGDLQIDVRIHKPSKRKRMKLEVPGSTEQWTGLSPIQKGMFVLTRLDEESVGLLSEDDLQMVIGYFEGANSGRFPSTKDTGPPQILLIQVVAGLLIVQGVIEALLGLLLVLGIVAAISPPAGSKILPVLLSFALFIIGGFRVYAGVCNYQLEGRRLGIAALSVGLLSLATVFCAPTAFCLAVFGLCVYLNRNCAAKFKDTTDEQARTQESATPGTDAMSPENRRKEPVQRQGKRTSDRRSTSQRLPRTTKNARLDDAKRLGTGETDTACKVFAIYGRVLNSRVLDEIGGGPNALTLKMAQDNLFWLKSRCPDALGTVYRGYIVGQTSDGRAAVGIRYVGDERDERAFVAWLKDEYLPQYRFGEPVFDVSRQREAMAESEFRNDLVEVSLEKEK